jgi:hypothetical protein
MNIRRWAIGGAVVSALAVTGYLVSSPSAVAVEESQDEPEPAMQRKLTHAQSALEALALEDFTAIAENASKLHQISIEADWESIPNKDYGHHANKFRLAVSAMEEAANDRNLDSAAWHYMQVVVTCVECHKAVRGDAPAEVALLLQ